MANEILIAASISASKGGGSVSGSMSTYLTLTGSEMIATVQTISTAVAAVPIGGCDQIQAIMIKNMPLLSDGVTANTATITVGLDNPITQTVAVIPPGGAALIPGANTTLYWKASAGTPDGMVVAVEN